MIVKGFVKGVIPVYINVTDLDEFFHADENSLVFYHLEEDSSVGSCDKSELTLTNIEFPIK